MEIVVSARTYEEEVRVKSACSGCMCAINAQVIIVSYDSACDYMHIVIECMVTLKKMVASLVNAVCVLTIVPGFFEPDPAWSGLDACEQHCAS